MKTLLNDNDKKLTADFSQNNKNLKTKVNRQNENQTQNAQNILYPQILSGLYMVQAQKGVCVS